jgi:hypothetical protein
MAKDSVFSQAARALNRAKYAKYTPEQVSELGRLSARKRYGQITPEEMSRKMKALRAGKSPDKA